MTPVHRPFKTSDADTVCTLPSTVEELSFAFPGATFPLTPDQLAAGDALRHDATVAVLNEQIVGYISFTEVQKKKFCTIGNLSVHEAFRRKGVGTYLVAVMIQTAIEKYAARFVRAACLSHNQAGYSLFSKFGFRPADMGQRLGPDSEPVLVIHLHLYTRNWDGGPQGLFQ